MTPRTCRISGCSRAREHQPICGEDCTTEIPSLPQEFTKSQSRISIETTRRKGMLGLWAESYLHNLIMQSRSTTWFVHKWQREAYSKMKQLMLIKRCARSASMVRDRD